MAIDNRKRSTRSTGRSAASSKSTMRAGKARGTTRRGAKATTRAKGANGKARAAEPEAARGSRRTCEAPGCGKSFRAYVARQRFCSNGCRSRAFYWDFKDRTGERYAAHLSGEAPARKSRARARRATRSA